MTENEITFRAAREEDLPALVSMLANDELGQHREDPSIPLIPEYLEAFKAIADSPHQLLVVADLSGEVVGTLQLSFIPGLARKGAWRGQIEAVRIAETVRGLGLGERMIEWAVAQCRAHGCVLVQLTSDKTRPEAHHFYEKLGFTASHLGYKLQL